MVTMDVTALIIIAFAVTLSVLVYFKKRKH